MEFAKDPYTLHFPRYSLYVFYHHMSAGKACIGVFCRLGILSHGLTSPDCVLRHQEPQRNPVTTLGYPDDLGSPLMTTLC